MSSFRLLGLGAGAVMSPLLSIALLQVPHGEAGPSLLDRQRPACGWRRVGVAIPDSIATGRTATLQQARRSVAAILAGGYRLCSRWAVAR